jgi:hypothetical protein
LNIPLWQNGLVVVILVAKFPLFNRNITPTGIPNIIFQNRNDVTIHHAPIKPIKKSAHNEGNVENVMFKNLFSGDLKLKVAENVNKSSKTNSIGVYITGLFCNSETCKSHWVVIYGDN